MKRYIDLLNASGADAWEIVDTKTKGWEFYFIRHRLDQNRAKNVEHITLKVYKNSADGTSMGMASARVSATEAEENLKKIIQDLVFQASLVKNRPYALNRPAKTDPVYCFMKTCRRSRTDRPDGLRKHEE